MQYMWNAIEHEKLYLLKSYPQPKDVSSVDLNQAGRQASTRDQPLHTVCVKISWCKHTFVWSGWWTMHILSGGGDVILIIILVRFTLVSCRQSRLWPNTRSSYCPNWSPSWTQIRTDILEANFVCSYQKELRIVIETENEDIHMNHHCHNCPKTFPRTTKQK